MAFITQTIEPTNAGPLSKQIEPVAVDCWFTKDGKAIPRLLKYMDSEGEIHTIENLILITSDDKNFSGISTKEIYCKAISENREYFFKLIFKKELCQWFIMWI